MKRQETRFQKKKRPDKIQMDALLKRCGIVLTPDQLSQLWTYHQLLRKHDEELNLTRIRNFENMVVKLYADSILPALQISLPSPLLDLGTGPGMPGIPLKIFKPHLHILLAESRSSRVEFLKTVVSFLNFTGLEVVERGIAPDYSDPVAGVITRAVEPMSDTLARVDGCLKKNGALIFMKGPRCDEEIKKAKNNFATAYKLEEDIPYDIPHTSNRRRLVIFQRLIDRRTCHAKRGKERMKRIKTIQSADNAFYREVKKLYTGRGVKKQGKTLVCGARLVAEAFEKWPNNCLAWITSGDKVPPPPKSSNNLTWIQLAPELFGEIDQFKTKHPIALFTFSKPEPWMPESESRTGCSLLIPFQDPENVGAVIRSAVAFDVDRVILLEESANPYHPKAVRASAGTVFSATLFQGPSLSKLPNTLPVISLSTTGQPLDRVNFPNSFCLLAGMEGPGLAPEYQGNAVGIPIHHKVESLNAAVAVAITLYAWRIRNKAA